VLFRSISGKIRRVELREREAKRVTAGDESGQFRERDYR
jgi:acetyl-CoA synthetase